MNKVKVEIPNFDIRKIANSGQIFRFKEIKDNVFELIFKDKLLYIKELSKKDDVYVYEFDCTQTEYETIWKSYFDIDTDYDYFIDSIDKNDAFLVEAVKYSKGIRILKQDKFEMLISFIISQRKSIPAIQSSIEKMSEKFAKEIAKGKYAFPTVEALANASIEELNACSLGYRSSYILETCQKINQNKMLLEDMLSLNEQDLIVELCKLKGVGKKVANCVALFGYYKIAAFPIDVWIQKVLDKYYKDGFPYERYLGYAGIIQQYMFYYERSK